MSSSYRFIDIKSAVVLESANLSSLFSGYGYAPTDFTFVSKCDLPTPNGYDGDYSQGSEFQIWIVLKHIPSSKYYKFVGTMDSYGSKTVSNIGFEAKVKEKTVTVYDFE